MGSQSTNRGLTLICVTIVAVIVCSEAATGRQYGTWVDRRRDRECQRSLICEYRQANCMNNSPQNQWRCTAIINSMQAKMCTLQICEKAQGMVCSETDPGENMTEVQRNSCALGYKCYAPVTLTTPTTLGTTEPAVTFARSTGVPGTTNDFYTEIPPGTESTVAGTMSTPPALVNLTTTGFPDENATDVIWSSAIQRNSTPRT